MGTKVHRLLLTSLLVETTSPQPVSILWLWFGRAISVNKTKNLLKILETSLTEAFNLLPV